jgi:hypothetical protein
MKYLALIALLLTLHLPAHQAASLTCTVRYTNAGHAVCWCKARRPGSRWQVYPMLVCQVANL